LGFATRILKPSFPLDLRTTLAPLGGRFETDGWWCAYHTPTGPTSIRIRILSGQVEASSWGAATDEALEAVPDLLGYQDRREEFSTEHPVVAPLTKRKPGMRMGRTSRVFDALLVAVVAQKVTGKEAGRGLKNLYRVYGQPAPGPNPTLRVPPLPESLAAAAYFDLHPLGIEKKRADTIHRVASQAEPLNALAFVEPSEARRVLETISGVGEWTSSETVVVSHGDPDAVSVGDYHMKNVVAWHLAGEPRGTDERMLELLEEFRPHRGRVVRFLEMLGPAPAYGPKMPVRSIERI